MAVREDKVYIADTGNNRIQVENRKLTQCVTKVMAREEVKMESLDCHRTYILKDMTTCIYVADFANQVFHVREEVYNYKTLMEVWA